MVFVLMNHGIKGRISDVLHNALGGMLWYEIGIKR